jgi:hypothetical protein
MSGTLTSAVLVAGLLLSCTRTPQTASQKKDALGTAVPVPLSGQAPGQQPPSPGQQPPSPGQQPPPPGKPSGPGLPGPGKPGQPAGTPAAPPRASIPLARGDAIQGLFARDRDRVSLPEDFKIGPLAASRDVEADNRGAVEAAERFLSALSHGKVDRELLAAGASAVAESAAYHLEKGDTPSSFRLGKPKPRAGGEVAVNVRLFGPAGTAEGEIYMTSENKQWLVSDLQVGMSALQVKREKPKEKFFPSSYRWLLGE